MTCSEFISMTVYFFAGADSLTPGINELNNFLIFRLTFTTANNLRRNVFPTSHRQHPLTIIANIRSISNGAMSAARPELVGIVQ